MNQYHLSLIVATVLLPCLMANVLQIKINNIKKKKELTIGSSVKLLKETFLGVEYGDVGIVKHINKYNVYVEFPGIPDTRIGLAFSEIELIPQ